MIPRHWLHYYLARLQLALRRPERALAEYNAAVEANPRFALAAAALGFLHATRGNYDEASRAFEHALTITPQDENIWFDLGFVYQQQKQYEDALRSFSRATELSPTLDRAWFGMGMIHVARGEYQQAIPAFRKAAELQPFSPHAFYELAKAHHALNHVDDVRKIIRRLSEFDPDFTKRLIRETGLLPHGVEPRTMVAER
jgi:tetratricopeptide (TPR) repeat protein